MSEKKGSPSDFPNIRSALPIFSERAWDALKPLLNGKKTERLPIQVKPDYGFAPYYLVNCWNVVDALDHSKSEVKYGDFKWFGLLEDRLENVHFFSVPESDDHFVSEEFVQCVEDHGLIGGKFVASREPGWKPDLYAMFPPRPAYNTKLSATTEKGQSKLQELLGYRLPEHYLTFLQKFPRSARKVERADAQLLIDTDVLLKVDDILEANDYTDSYEKWPKDFFAMGLNGSGDTYAINRRKKLSPVYLYLHGSESYYEYAPTCDDFLALRLREIEEENAELDD
ncbi:MAG: SMI1/KNR4 family protein [Planctomycetales bacterium]|nr:SMI1/KNR4 family protein [Planctomycetales bacterium]